MKVTAIVPAAGSGERMSTKKGPRKPFFVVDGKPILIHTLLKLQRSNYINSIVAVVHKDDLAKWRRQVKRFGIGGAVKVVPGGKTRSESVKNGLSRIDPDTDIVFIHDGVRPLISRSMILKSIKACRRFGASVCAVPVVSTIKSVSDNLMIKDTPKRRGLYIAQTPQVFKKKIIDEAYKKGRSALNKATDDCVLVERIGRRIKIVPGSYRNIKVTTPEDLIFLNAML